MTQYAAVLDVSTLNGTTGFQLNGEASGDYSGTAIGVTDLNGDGFADLIIGADYADPNADRAGATYVVYGKATGFAANIDLSTLNGTNGFQINGEAAIDISGHSVASAGDVNGDGIDDMIIGAVGAGDAYIVFGKTGSFGATLELSSLNGTNGFQITGEVAGDHVGYSVSSAGDVNGDGFGDVIIGANYASPHGSHSGAAYVVFGKDTGFGANLNLSSLNGANGFKLSGEAATDLTGISVSSAGDINNDGFDDVMVSGHQVDSNGTNSGSTYVIFGTDAAFAANIDLSTLNGTNGFEIVGEAMNNRSGRTVSGAGDVNADGFADIIIGANGANGGIGASYVVFGTDAGFGATLNLSSLNGSTGFQINGELAGDNSGFRVANAGDFNGDGFSDVVVTATSADPHGTSSGAAYLVFGKASGFAADFNLSTLDGNNGFQINGEAAGDIFGRAAAAGDVNGDGFSDLVIGAYGAAPHGTNSGATYVIFGGMPGEAVNRTGTAIDNTIHGGNFGDTLSGLGGDDHLIGHGGNDTLIGGAGDDSLDGGDGSDTADYSAASGALTIDLRITTAQAVGGGLGSDTLTAVENVIGGASADHLIGNTSANTLSGGGADDLLEGGAGDDTFDGGTGIDTVTYVAATGGVTVNLATAGAQAVGGGQGNDTFASIENLVGGNFTDHLTGNGSANTINGGGGNDVLDGAGGNDVLDGGFGNDAFILSGGGNDTAFGGASSGDDIFDFGAAFTNLDIVDGGGGIDAILLNGDYSGGVVFRNTSMINIETLTVAAGFDYSLTIADTNIAQNKTLTVDGSALDAGHGLTLDASREKDGFVALAGGLGADTLTGGRRADSITGGDGDDTLTGGQGADAMDGGAGADIFVFTKAKDSAGTKYDTITGFDAAADRIDVNVVIGDVDDTIAAGTLSAASLSADLKAAADKTHLLANHAVLFTPDAGDLAGTIFLIVDLDGRAGFSGAHDLVARLDAAASLGSLDASTFI